MAAEQLGPGAGVGSTALARRLADADPIVDHQDPEAAVHRDTYLDAGGVGMPRDIGQGFSEDGGRFELHHQRDDAVVYAMERDFRFVAEVFGRCPSPLRAPWPANRRKLRLPGGAAPSTTPARRRGLDQRLSSHHYQD